MVIFIIEFWIAGFFIQGKNIGFDHVKKQLSQEFLPSRSVDFERLTFSPTRFSRSSVILVLFAMDGSVIPSKFFCRRALRSDMCPSFGADLLPEDDAPLFDFPFDLPGKKSYIASNSTSSISAVDGSFFGFVSGGLALSVDGLTNGWTTDWLFESLTTVGKFVDWLVDWSEKVSSWKTLLDWLIEPFKDPHESFDWLLDWSRKASAFSALIDCLIGGS